MHRPRAPHVFVIVVFLCWLVGWLVGCFVVFLVRSLVGGMDGWVVIDSIEQSRAERFGVLAFENSVTLAADVKSLL